MPSPNIFVIAFEHSHRAFKCVRLDGARDAAPGAAQWIVTLEGRTVWSFDAREGDTREGVRREVERWWDQTSAGRSAATG